MIENGNLSDFNDSDDEFIEPVSILSDQASNSRTLLEPDSPHAAELSALSAMLFYV